MRSLTNVIALLTLATSTLGSPAATEKDLTRHRLHQASGREWSEFLEHRDTPAGLLLNKRGNANLDLEKRRGGGGGGGGGGGRGGGGSTSSGGSSSGGSRGGSSGSSGGSSSSTSSRPTYGGGAYYGGGSATPYSPGIRSPGASIAPFLLAGASLGLLAAAWPHGAWMYPWNTPYRYHNNSSNQNQTIPVKCLCDPYNPCSCDDNGNSTFLDSVISPNGTSTDQSVARIASVNNTQTLFLNGTLANGTDDDTSSGSTVAMQGILLPSRPAIDAVFTAAIVVVSIMI